jgi:hypothetical protein
MPEATNERKTLRVVAGAATTAGLFGLVYWYRRPVPTWRDGGLTSSDWSLVRRYLPQAEFSGEVSVNIEAEPERIFRAIQLVTLAEMPLANWIGRLRYLPGRLFGTSQEGAAAVDIERTPFIQLLQAQNTNIILAEEPNREVVMGAIGKFHNLLDQHFVLLESPEEFMRFEEPDYQKLAMSFRITPLSEERVNRLSLIHGTHAMSRAARWKFGLYWIGIKPGGNFVSWLMLRAIKRMAEGASEQLAPQVQANS